MKVRVSAWFLLAAAPAWGTGWAALEGGRFTIWTSAPEPETRRALTGLEEMADGMEALWGPLPEHAPPLRVYLFADLAGLRSMGAQGFSKGFFQSGPDYDAIAAAAGEADSIRALRHEYVHRVLHRTARRLPQWLEEGLAELYSTLSRDRAHWLAGLPIRSHIEFLRRARWVDFAALERMHLDEGLWFSADGVMLYYGQSWALAHYLAIASPRAARFQAFLDRLMLGEDASAALEAEYQMRPQDILREARARIEQGRFAVQRIEATAAAARPAARWRPLDETEAAIPLAELAAATGHRPEDQQFLDALRKAAKGSPRARVRLGVLALRRGDKSAAEAEFRAAVNANVEEPAAWFELAMLIRDRQGPASEVRRLLERTVELNPAHGEALYLLAMDEHRAGRTAAAVALLERAARALPRQFAFREALARVYAGLGRAAAAREQAVAARAAARTGNERAMAEGLLRELDQAAAPRISGERKPEVTIPRGWLEPRRDGEVQGVLTHVHCGDPVVFDVLTAEGQRRFRARPASLMVSGRPQDAPFSCGGQTARPRIAARSRLPDWLVQLVFLDPSGN
jgi:tetratricopeptide (TPR) repeat protein